MVALRSDKNFGPKVIFSPSSLKTYFAFFGLKYCPDIKSHLSDTGMGVS